VRRILETVFWPLNIFLLYLELVSRSIPATLIFLVGAGVAVFSPSLLPSLSLIVPVLLVWGLWLVAGFVAIATGG